MANYSSALVDSELNTLDRILKKLRLASPGAMRIAALRRFATGITVLTIFGHAYLGFEQSIAQPVVAVLACYITEILLETLTARNDRRRPAYASAPHAKGREKAISVINFLLPAHISGLALGMLLYASNRLDLFVVAAVIAMSSKSVSYTHLTLPTTPYV